MANLHNLVFIYFKSKYIHIDNEYASQVCSLKLEFTWNLSQLFSSLRPIKKFHITINSKRIINIINSRYQILTNIT